MAHTGLLEFAETQVSSPQLLPARARKRAFVCRCSSPSSEHCCSCVRTYYRLSLQVTPANPHPHPLPVAVPLEWSAIRVERHCWPLPLQYASRVTQRVAHKRALDAGGWRRLRLVSAVGRRVRLQRLLNRYTATSISSSASRTRSMCNPHYFYSSSQYIDLLYNCSTAAEPRNLKKIC